MKFRNFITAGLSLSVLGLASAPAQAVVEYAGQYTFLGAFTTPPTDPNSESFSRDQADGFPTGAFSDYWLFTIDPTANAQMSVNFVPFGSITDFVGGIYNTSGFTCGTAGTTCTAGSIGTMIVSSGLPNVATPGVQTVLSAGTYAVRVAGTNVGDPNQTSYTGQVAFQAVPEPGSLALAGLGLLGLAAARRRKS